jgi:hypothetical protein
MQPWIARPYALISWWNMEKFAAEHFVGIGSQLAGMSGLMNRLHASQTVGLDDRIETSAKLKKMIETCRKIGLRVTAGHAEQVVRNLETEDARFSGAQVSQMLTSLGMNLTSEMQTHMFMRIFPERSDCYEHSELFGASVGANFASATRDIKDAGTCYAVDRNTACVMHLMRVLEVGLNTLATELHVAFDRRNWENVINDIDAEIKKINGPSWGADWKEKLQFYSGAAKDFRYFKDAWRNHAMHHREHYDASEAKSIFEHVKAFTAHLAENGLQEKPIL